MKTLRKLCCWWSGHQINWRYDHGQCDRCEEWHDFDSALGKWQRIRNWWIWSRPRWMRPVQYFSKCRDCGQRFNRHTNDCPPF